MFRETCEKAAKAAKTTREERREATPSARPDPNTTTHHPHPPQHPRQRGRTIPATVRRAVWSRDEARCTYVDSSTGQRCRETHHLELHHEIAFAHGGAHSASNLTLRCKLHNTLAAEAAFGREFIAQQGASRHESYLRQSSRDLA